MWPIAPCPHHSSLFQPNWALYGSWHISNTLPSQKCYTDQASTWTHAWFISVLLGSAPSDICWLSSPWPVYTTQHLCSSPGLSSVPISAVSKTLLLPGTMHLLNYSLSSLHCKKSGSRSLCLSCLQVSYCYTNRCTANSYGDSGQNFLSCSLPYFCLKPTKMGIVIWQMRAARLLKAIFHVCSCEFICWVLNVSNGYANLFLFNP